MGNIFNILVKIFPTLVFAFYFALSFFIIGRYNQFYNSNIISRSNSLVASTYKTLDSYKNYFMLGDVNKNLADENAKLLNQVIALQTQKSERIADSNYSAQSQLPQLSRFKLIPAKVIHNSIANIRNYIIIDKGSADGLHKDMGVISRNGPVGVVIEVNEHYSSIMSFINKDMTVSARVASTSHVGQLKWTGGDIRLASLDEIPKHIKLKKGDKIVTSGFSSYFPEGIPIGQVLKQKEDVSNFANIQIQIYNDFSNLDYVYLINNNSQSEIQAVESRIIQKQSTSKNE